MGVELVPKSNPAGQKAVTRAIAAVMDATPIASPWWSAGLDEALGQRAVGPPRPSAYEAVRSPRSTRGATRA